MFAEATELPHQQLIASGAEHSAELRQPEPPTEIPLPHFDKSTPYANALLKAVEEQMGSDEEAGRLLKRLEMQLWLHAFQLFLQMRKKHVFEQRSCGANDT